MNIIPTTIRVISGINECVSLFQWVRSAVSLVRSQRSAINMQNHQDLEVVELHSLSDPQEQTLQEDVALHSQSDAQERTLQEDEVMQSQSDPQEQTLQEDEVLQLQSDLRGLKDTLPVVYNLIDRAEWRNHEQCVAEVLQNLKDAVYEAEDLLDEFAWYELKMSAEGNDTSVQPFIDFFRSVSHGSFNKVTDIRKRLDNLSSHLKDMGLHQVTPRFDKTVRPETSSFPTETKIFGREEEVKRLITFLGIPAKNVRANSKRKRTKSTIIGSASNQVSSSHGNNETKIPSFSVLPIVGLGGVGKTTLAQSICNHPQVKSHFDWIIWTCVSDDFDVTRLTKDAIQSYSRREAVITDHLTTLQRTLANKLKSKRLLLVLDDVWDDALQENRQCWKRFFAPFENTLHGSMILVTTRSQNVADKVHTMGPIKLEGLKHDVFWDFFKHIVFGLNSSQIEPELERIGRNILPKLMGSPLAAKTIGRLLQMSLDATHWENILNSELWELRQEETDILPALRLSYTYLPLHLKRCFSFCAVYPKDQKFEKQSLAQIWVAQGFFENRVDIPTENIGHQYFDDLVNRSFFEKHRGSYVIHDLMHDMAQLVSKGECFIIRNESDFQKIPKSVRHLSILSSININKHRMLSLCRYRKLRTLICDKSIRNEALASVMDGWCTELLCLRVFLCTYIRELPDSISNLKHLRYLKVSRSCTFKRFPSGFCNLYNLMALDAKSCRLECLPSDLSKMINLQRFESQTLQYHQGLPRENQYHQGLDTSLSIRFYHGEFLNCWFEPRHYVPDIRIIKIEYCDRLVSLPSFIHLCYLEELMVSNCPNINSTCLSAPSLKKLDFEGDCGNLADNIDCRSLTYLHISHSRLTSIQLQMWNLPALQELQISYCASLAFIGKSGQVIGNSTGSIFSSLTELTIEKCGTLSSLEQFLQPDYVPCIRIIKITYCARLVSLPCFSQLHCLEEMEVCQCPNINSTCLFSPYLKKLELEKNSGNLADNIDCSSLTYFCLSRSNLTSIQLQTWNLPALQKLEIKFCSSLTFIGNSEQVFSNHSEHGGHSSAGTFPSLTDLTIFYCKKLLTVDDFSGSFPLLKNLKITDCQLPNGQRGMKLPSSLESLHLSCCGDLSAWFPRRLENLTSLRFLVVHYCDGELSIPGHMWSSDLQSVRFLKIEGCPDLVSVGGPKEIAGVANVLIVRCPKLKGLKEPVAKRYFHEINVCPDDDVGRLAFGSSDAIGAHPRRPRTSRAGTGSLRVDVIGGLIGGVERR